ncbi:MFS multidrug transporter [Xylaria bambusicola]|uniref:MFS multidrug transporter n=1 Tax=Xylaria bambusicola TaxID=326684 RepID=UPI002008E7AE|nr:MFS multidrug transporter [Xylaria bambusicola]KAI0506383.1 MFS multidrug transporter [Xylaria bambusicola]
MTVSQAENEVLPPSSLEKGSISAGVECTDSDTIPADKSVWTAVDDPERPLYWPRLRKWTATMIMSAFSFLQPLSETMLAPAEKTISDELHIKQEYQWYLVNSLILVGVGLSPLLLAPLSEVYGRKPVLIVASTIFVIWNVACGASSTLGQILAFRLLSGFGASVADALAGGLMSDLWSPEERGKAFAFYMAAPLLGPALGPILGAFISEGTNWRWIFYVTSIASGAVIILAITCLHETYEPRLEQRRRRAADKSSLKPTISSQSTKAFLELMRENLQRPFRMLGTQIIIQLLATYMALLYGTMFLFLFVYPLLWTEQYGESVSIGSLNYISFALGLILGVNIAGHLNDYIYLKLKARNNGIGRPEFRVPPMIIGTALVPIGLLWWGWTGQAKLHWILPNIGSLILGTGVYCCSGCVSVYTIDAYSRYAASAVSTNLVARSLTAAFFPLFAPYLFDALGFGLGSTVLAGAFAVLGSVVVFILWFFGENLRARSPYCAATGN